MARTSHPLQSAQWKYAAAFQINVAVDLTAAYSSLDVEQFDEYARPALRDVAQAPAGMLFIEGGPGSGKTTFATKIVAQICEDSHVDPVLFAIKGSSPAQSATGQADAPTDSSQAVTPAADDSDESAEDWVFGPKRKVTEFPQFKNPPVFWCTPGHALCYDIVPKLKRLVAGEVVHVYPWAMEMSALLPQDMPDEQFNEETVHMSPAERSMLGAAKVRDIRAREDPHSLASLAKAMALDPANPLANFDELLDFSRLGDEEKPALIERSRRLRREILVAAANQARVLVGTPVSLGQLGDNFKTDSKLTIIDEAGRIPESSFWIPVSHFPGPVIAIGDQYQFGPVAKSADIDPKRSSIAGWRSVFGQQRKLSVLHRAA
jgi:hypothetical protein